ncbi:MAG TPA: Gfo/Idh/MocA family oxidoreductase, partial [Candidatus Cloacimonetes bacterium]|nr:Gfo/Idh/MocA family oxidoreductase [Candidatus Cloacimonadota bacterium]
MIQIGVIGVGYWGPNIIRNIMMNKRMNVKTCADIKEERLDFIQSIYPSIRPTKNYHEIIQDPSIDAVAICLPVELHYKVAKAALKAGKHVLIEKPMTANSWQAYDIINLAEQKNLIILVDHTFLFKGAVRKIVEIVNSNEIGNLYYFDSVRVNLGLFQHDVNVVWDLAPHDISIMDHVINRKAESVVATGADHIGNGLEDVAYVTVYYPDNIIGHIHVNWLSPVKIRQTLIGGTRKMIVWDDNSPSENIKVYDKGIEVIQTPDQIYNTLIQYRTGDMYCPKVDQTEALAVEMEHFADCIEKKCKPISDGYS